MTRQSSIVPIKAIQGCVQRPGEIRIARCCSSRPNHHEEPTGRAPPLDVPGPGCGTEPTAHSIPLDRRPDPPRDRERHAGAQGRGVGGTARPDDGEPGSPHPVTGSTERTERRTRRDPVDQADRRCRPLRRRFLRIARPARVDIRCRNPCLRARRRLFGW